MKKIIFITLTIIMIFGLLWVVPQTHPAEAAAPDNDEFENARIITSLPFTDTVDTTEATINPLDPIYVGNSPQKSVWYRFTPSQNMNVVPISSKSNYANSIGIYTGDYATGLTTVYFQYGVYEIPCPLYAGVTYYFQITMVSSTYPLPEDERAILIFELTQRIGPENDFFTDATVIDNLPYSINVNLRNAWYEENEPLAPTGFFGTCDQTVWYKYIPVVDEIVYGSAYSRLRKSLLVTTTNNLSDMHNEFPRVNQYEQFAFHAIPGETYYLQFCAYDEGLEEFPLYLSDVELVSPYFYTNPSYPYGAATVEFCDNSYDPAGSPMVYYWWDFGDGTTLESIDACVKHWYAEDGEYFIWHKVQPEVGLPAEMGELITLESHDVSAAYVKTPYWLEVGKTYQFHVGVQSKYTYEDVRVYLFMLSRTGEMAIGYVDVDYITPEKGTVNVPFEYTVTPEDAKKGIVVFKEQVYLGRNIDRDKSNNKAYSFPVMIFDWTKKNPAWSLFMPLVNTKH